MSDAEDELFAPPFPSAEDLAAYRGRWVGIDERGVIRVAGATHDEACDRAQEQGLLDALSFLGVPAGAVLG